eukprot:TRINITY_DN23033_c0_g1_i1.p2 TRINITY_DN23033_c0_g1~~TRINITY_DN23033_c0_g1_i1.p2  ORF type:complete len:140 (+),score=39.37 TRINITY_DN23033_c0_g1_i1:64-483(+)
MCIRDRCIEMYETLATLKQDLSELSASMPTYKKKMNETVKQKLLKLKNLLIKLQKGDKRFGTEFSEAQFGRMERITELEIINAKNEEQLQNALRELQAKNDEITQLKETIRPKLPGEFISPENSISITQRLRKESPESS